MYFSTKTCRLKNQHVSALNIALTIWLLSLLASLLFVITGNSLQNSQGDAENLICRDDREQGECHDTNTNFPGDSAAGDDTVELAIEFYNYLINLVPNSPYPGVDNYTVYMVSQQPDLKPGEDVLPIRPDFGPVINDVTSFRYLQSVPPCQSSKKNRSSASVFVAINSASENGDMRDAVRMTWLEKLKNTDELLLAGYAFLVGRPFNDSIRNDLEYNSRDLNDVIEVDLHDSSLALKKASLLNWLMTHCSDVDFLFLVNDDIYVNVHNLALTIRSISSNIAMPALYGYRVINPPVRGVKCQVSFQTWPWSRYPSFLSVASLLMTGKSIRPLLAAIQTTPFMAFDDVYLTGLCSEKAKVQLWASNSMLKEEISYHPDPCVIRDWTAWATSSAGQMTIVERDVHKFYEKNMTACTNYVMESARRFSRIK